MDYEFVQEYCYIFKSKLDDYVEELVYSHYDEEIEKWVFYDYFDAYEFSETELDEYEIN